MKPATDGLRAPTKSSSISGTSGKGMISSLTAVGDRASGVEERKKEILDRKPPEGVFLCGVPAYDFDRGLSTLAFGEVDADAGLLGSPREAAIGGGYHLCVTNGPWRLATLATRICVPVAAGSSCKDA